MPCGSRPLAGSSKINVCGSPSSAAASPSRWAMPKEKVRGFFLATAVRPTRARTSSTRPFGRELAAASIRRWLRARRVGWNEPVSSIVPISSIGRRMSRKRRPSNCVRPPPWSRSSIRRSVVDLPAPLGPRKPVTTPGRTSNDKSSTASLSPYLFVSPCATIMESVRSEPEPTESGTDLKLVSRRPEPAGSSSISGVVQGLGAATSVRGTPVRSPLARGTARCGRARRRLGQHLRR